MTGWRTRAGVSSLCCLGLAAILAGPALAATGVTAWDQSFRSAVPGTGSQHPVAVRELADGSRMVVALDNAGFAAIRYDAAGALLSTATFYPPFTINVDPMQTFDPPTELPAIGIDAFGSIFFGAITAQCCSQFYNGADAWIMKYDGATGLPAWPAPYVYSGPQLDSPRKLLVDDRGDLVVSILSSAGGSLFEQVTVKLDGATGNLFWAGPGINVLPGAVRTAATLDAAGNILVAVGQYNVNYTATSIEAVKYSGVTGGVLWGPVSFDSPADETPRAAAVTPNGDFVVTGQFATPTSRGFQTIAFDGQTGSLLWGPSRWTAPAGASDSPPTTIAVSPSGTVFVAGYSGSNPASTATLALSGATGNILWGSLTEASSPGILLTTGNGDLVTLTQTANQIQASRLRGGDGVTVWGPIGWDMAYNFDSLPIGAIASNGDLFSAAAVANPTDTDVSVFERELTTGSFAWGPKAFSGAADGIAAAQDLTVGPDGNAVVTGYVTKADGTFQWATIKYDSATGAPLWGPVFFDTHEFGSGNPWQVLTDPSGDVVVAGYALVNNEDRLAVVKYAGTTGQVLWTSALVSNFYPQGLAVDGAGNILVMSQLYTENNYDVGVLKLSGATGQSVWGPILYDVAPEDYPSSVTADANNDVIVSGSGYDGMTGEQHWFTVKAASATGATIWGPVLSEGTYEAPARAVVDPSGDVVIVGTLGDLQGYRMLTIKYSGATGAKLWGPIYYDSPIHYAGGSWTAVDAQGNVFVTGISWSEQNDVYNADYVTLKYRGSDGAILWGPVLFDGPNHGYELVYSVELDAAGNPVVSGDSETFPKEYRIATLKYDGATGAVLWGPVFNWPSGTNDSNGLAVRGSHVFVCGSSDRAFRATALTEDLGIVTLPEDLPPIECGETVTSLSAQNGSPGYRWSLVSGALPAGLTLESDGSFSGNPVEEGAFPFRAQVQDSLGATAARDFTLSVGAGPFASVLAAAGASCHVTLSLDGIYATYEWLPGGETTPTIDVSPKETTVYGVRVDNGSGCMRLGSVTVYATALTQPGCLAPSLKSVTPSSGPSAGGTPITIAGGNFQNGASVEIGLAGAGNVNWVGPTEITAATPALPAGSVADVLVQNPDSGYALLRGAFAVDFLDVAPSDPFHDYILTVLREGISSGCGGGNYCPNASVTRAQMAVFLVKAKFGGGYQPPPASGTVFADVPADAFAAAFIEQLAALGVTTGCGGGNYCPDALVTRAQMAVFLLKTSLGETYVPPPAVGIFGDVPVGSFADAWIEDLYGRGITGGCSVSPLLYCPNNPNTRGQMAVFLVKAFSP